MIPDAPATAPPLILASRSPRRRGLLELLIPPDRVRVVPPADPREESLAGLTTWRSVEAGLLRIAAAKRDAVRRQVAEVDAMPWAAVVAADTAIVAGADDGETGGGLAVLGQPPADDWEATVRRWFRTHYVGRTHVAATAVSVAAPGAGDPQTGQPGRVRTAEAVVRTRVTVRADAERHLDRLIAAGEPVGRAGGLAIDGLFGSLLVERVDGSLSNVSGLPLRETLALLTGLGVKL